MKAIAPGAIVAAIVVVILIAAAGYFIFGPAQSTQTYTEIRTVTDNYTSMQTTTLTQVSTYTVTLTVTTTALSSSSPQSVQIIIPKGVGSQANLNFQPYTLTVAPGTIITFVNQDTTTVHNVDFVSAPSGASVGISPNTNKWTNESYSVMLTVPGTYSFSCDYHSWMQGTITVT